MKKLKSKKRADSTQKVAFLGDPQTGKTALIKSIIDSIFTPEYRATPATELCFTEKEEEEKTELYYFFDIGLHSAYRPPVGSFLRNSNAAVIVYDITNWSSFLNTKEWIKEVRDVRDKDFLIVLVGNKADVPEKREVSMEEGQQRAIEFGVPFLESSAKLAINLEEILRRVSI